VHRADDAAKHQQRHNTDAEHSFSVIIAAHRYLLDIESQALGPTVGCATTERWVCQGGVEVLASRSVLLVFSISAHAAILARPLPFWQLHTEAG
jgi:outer membrane protease